MPKYTLLVFSRPKPGREADYCDWYDHTHIGEVIQAKGFQSGQRFAVVRRMGPAAAEANDWPYAALYEVEADNPDQAFAELGRLGQTGKMTMSDAIDPAGACLYLIENASGKIVAS